MSEKARKPTPAGLASRRAKAERRLKVFNLLKAGVSVAEIALQEGLSARRTREIVQEALDRREIDPPQGFAQLQIGRLGDALMVAHAAMMEGDLQALDRVVRIVGELDRYHGFPRASSQAPAALPPPSGAPALALPAPAEAAENRSVKD